MFPQLLPPPLLPLLPLASAAPSYMHLQPDTWHLLLQGHGDDRPARRPLLQSVVAPVEVEPGSSFGSDEGKYPEPTYFQLSGLSAMRASAQ